MRNRGEQFAGKAWCAACAMLLAQSAAWPASAEAPEVMVTARKRIERLQDTPIAVTVLSGADLRLRRIDNLSEIARSTPNLVFDPSSGNTGSSTSSQVYIRGVGQNDFLFTTEPGVAIYVDGVYLPRSIGSVMDLIGIDRIEVLRGPQGTLFGKNAVGGAIDVITRRPGVAPAAEGSFSLGEGPHVRASGWADLPVLPSRLSAQIAVLSDNRQGYIRRVKVGDREGDAHAFAVRGKLLWTPQPGFEALTIADYTRRRERAAADTIAAINPQAPLLSLWNALVGAPRGQPYDQRFVSADPFVDRGTGPNFSRLDLWGLSQTLEWRSGSTALKSITAYRRQLARFAVDNDHSPIEYVQQDQSDRERQFSQELQLTGSALGGRLDYVLGAMHLDEAGSDDFRVEYAPGLFEALEALPPGVIPGLGGAGNPANAAFDFRLGLADRIAIRSDAAFAHLDLALTSRLRLSGGLRYTRDAKDFHSRFDHVTAGVTAYDIATRGVWSALTPKAELDYHLTPAVMGYISASRGFKSGGFNGRAASEAIARQPFAPEFVWTYEAGLKSAWLGQRLIVNGALFYSDYTDLQLTTVVSDPSAGIAVRVQNAGAARIEGFELEAQARPAADLNLNASVGYLNARYVRLAPGVADISLSSRLAKTPRWSIGLGADYTLRCRTGAIVLRADFAYRSRTDPVANNSELLAQKGFGLLGAGATWSPGGADWSLGAYATNLTNVRHRINGLSALDGVGIAEIIYGRPREVGVRFNVRR